MKKTIKKSSKLMEELLEKVAKKQKKSTIKDVLIAIEKWSEDNDVSFIGSFISFNDKNDVDETEIIAFGRKNELKLHLETLSEMVEEEGDKDEFINL